MGALGNLVPLVILFALIGAFAWVGYQMYVYANELADRGVKKMEKKHMTFSKDGMKVGVKEMRDEDYADKQQSVLVKGWNLSSAKLKEGNPNTTSSSSSRPSSAKKR